MPLVRAGNGVNQSLSSRVVNGVIIVIGLALGLADVVGDMITVGVVPGYVLFGIPLIMIMGWFPMLIGRTGGGIEIRLDTCVLIFLCAVTEPVTALAVWSIGVTLGQVFSDKRPSVKLFNIALGVIAGGLAVVTFTLTRSSTETSPRELLAAGLAGAVYFVVDFVMSAISLSLEEGSSLRQELAPTGALGPLVAFLGIAALGYLASIVVRQLPAWSAALLVVPVSTILIASRAQSRGSEHTRRLKILLDLAVRVQTVTERTEVLDALHAGAVDLLRDPRVGLRSTPPVGSEVGVAVSVAPDEDLWLVGPARNRARATAHDDRQGMLALVAVAEDALTRLRLSEDMAHLAWHDSLTKLPNRSLFMDRVEHAVAMHARRGGQLAVLFCDLDGFKRVNDLFGHAAGDSLLVEVGHRINGSVREVDTVARLGGDEFAVLLEDVDDPTHISGTCERILEALRDRFEISGEEVSVTTTIGVAVSARRDSAETLLSHADLAMYHAKGQGKNRYETYRLGFGDERLQRIALIEALRRAIDAKELQVAYQPVVDLRSRITYGVEALVRWRRDGGLVPPDLFIPAAEESGLIVSLGAAVLDLVAADTPALREAAGRNISIGVNISAQQLHEPEFPAQIAAARATMGDVELVLELTERDFVANDQQTVAAMTELAGSGVRFAIDDFGVGFSSIGYLQRLPVDVLKIDRSFLTHIEDDERACSLVRSMVVMGKALGLDVVIEGVERLTQLDHIVNHADGAIGQGYLFARPMPFDEMEAALIDQRRTSPPRLTAIS